LKRALVLLAALPFAALAVTLGACETVDLGAPPADINACRPSQSFFVDAIWPMVMAQDYGGVHCYDSTCHGGASNNSLRLIFPPVTGVNTTTGLVDIPLTGDWAANYKSTTQQMNCSNVAASKLLSLPTNQRPHRGGMLIMPDGPEAQLIQMWVSQP
jgi:hypothetical protein